MEARSQAPSSAQLTYMIAHRKIHTSYPLPSSLHAIWSMYVSVHLHICLVNWHWIVKPVLDDATKEIIAQRDEVARLKTVADKHPFYKYNGVWTRELQNLVSCVWARGTARIAKFETGNVDRAMCVARRAWRVQGYRLGFIPDYRRSREVPEW